MRRINLTLILLIFASNIALAGLYFIELPNNITDDMYFHQSEEVRVQLKQLIDRELEGKNEDIAVVVFTRDGEPVKPTNTFFEHLLHKKIIMPINIYLSIY